MLYRPGSVLGSREIQQHQRPNINSGGGEAPRRPHGVRSFVTHEYGDLDGDWGYWATDENGDDGFLEEEERRQASTYSRG